VNRAGRLLCTVAMTAASAWLGCNESSPAPTVTDSTDGGPTAEGGPLQEQDASRDGRVDDTGAAHDAAGVEEPVIGSAACTSYCSKVMLTCTADFAQFVTLNACLRACAYYPPGDPDDYLSNSLACRGAHIEAALVEIGHCPHAGAFGIDGCGTSCDGFCQLAMGWCSASSGGAPFASAVECQSACASFPYAPTGPNGEVRFNAHGPTSGDTLDCRMYQLVSALKSVADRDVHCPLAATTSAACR
jgi:hypothetical protein